MKRLLILGAAILTLSLTGVALAGQASGTTTLLSDAYADTPTEVEVTISTGAPVVPYEYSLVNKCWFDGKARGRSDSYERFDLAGPWFNPGGDDPPTTIETINVQPIPAGSTCKVFIIKKNTVVKGSTTTYDVVLP